MKLIPARARMAGAAVAAMAAFGAVVALPASATAADRTTVATDAAEVEAVERIEGPFATEHECRVVRGEFARYHQVTTCYKPDLVNAWYFNWFE